MHRVGSQRFAAPLIFPFTKSWRAPFTGAAPSMDFAKSGGA